MATTVTSKGQVTIPKPVREHLGITPGSQVEFRRATDGSIVIEKADGTRRPSRFAKLLGIAHAEVEQLPLLTRDTRRYRTYFPAVMLIAPQANA